MRNEAVTKAEVVIHPARLRIVQALKGRQMTTKQIGDLLPDVPSASLYRHLKLLKDHGIVEVIEQRSRNGIPESVYALGQTSTHFSREEFAAISGEDHQRFYAVFLGALSSVVNRYFEEPDFDSTGDGMTYFIGNLNLSDAQRQRLRLDLLDLVRRYALESAEDDRRPTQLGISLAPDLTIRPEAP